MSTKAAFTAEDYRKLTTPNGRLMISATDLGRLLRGEAKHAVKSIDGAMGCFYCENLTMVYKDNPTLAERRGGKPAKQKAWMCQCCHTFYTPPHPPPYIPKRIREVTELIKRKPSLRSTPDAAAEADRTRQAVWQKAYRERKRLARLAAKTAEKKKRLCECGAPLEKGMRLCPGCRKSNRRATFAKSKAKKRVIEATVI